MRPGVFSTEEIRIYDMTDYEVANRIGKGHSLIDIPSDYTVIDLETTGLSPRCDEIIELAALRVRNDEVVDSFQQLVKPEHDIDGFITSLTGITNEMVANAPCIQSVLPDFISFVRDDIVVGHNVSFDVNFIFDNMVSFFGKPFGNDYINTIRIAKRLVALPHYRLSDLCGHFAICVKDAHRALADCHMTHALFCALKSIFKATGNNVSELFFLPGHRSARTYRHIDARLISCQISADEIDKDNPIYGKYVVFTGALEKFKRSEAMQLVANLGGINQNGVTKATDYLVLGNNDYCATIKDGKSSKQKKAEEYMLKGTGIAIMDEKTFYDMVSAGDD